ASDLGRERLVLLEVEGRKHDLVASLGPDFAERPADPAGTDDPDLGLGACRARGERQNAQHHAGPENLEKCATAVFHEVSPGKRPTYHVLWPRIPVGNRTGKDPARGAESRSAVRQFAR